MLSQFQQQVAQQYPEMQPMIQSIAQNNPEYASLAAQPANLIAYLCQQQPEQIQKAIEGYISFCDTFKQKQLDFVRSENYAHQDYAKVNAEVYQNEAYMLNTYYPALLFSYLFSSNYYEIYRIFCQNFLPMLADRQGNSCEIGIGHGFLTASLLSKYPQIKGFGMDISPVAAEVCPKVAAFFNLQQPITLAIADATQHIPYANNEIMICAEVLEHLPNPKLLLEKIYAALAPNGLFFLTASINMESVDHLYLFQSDAEVLEMVKSVGFKAQEQHVAFLSTQNYRNNPEMSQKLMRRKNPATAVMILSK